MLTFDHIALSCEGLETGAADVAAALGQEMLPGGHHPAMGTHNRLLSMGPGEYSELVAIDPEAPAPDRPRWFDLDAFSGATRITNWICRCDDLDSALALAPDGAGVPIALTRGDLSWTMAVPEDGKLPFAGLFPAMIQWQRAAHPAERLADTGLRLAALRLISPDAAALSAALAPLITDDRIAVLEGPSARIEADLDTPKGRVTL
ncbi:VOC family protein [Gymnodinialimonas sp. 2305UL16-5]|uniref:VOC family protein n=1 Tax=Gymnodinialimonas mytili TaxID=3126503 RepID=UPI0030AC2D99